MSSPLGALGAEGAEGAEGVLGQKSVRVASRFLTCHDYPGTPLGLFEIESHLHPGLPHLVHCVLRLSRIIRLTAPFGAPEPVANTVPKVSICPKWGSGAPNGSVGIENESQYQSHCPKWVSGGKLDPFGAEGLQQTACQWHKCLWRHGLGHLDPLAPFGAEGAEAHFLLGSVRCHNPFAPRGLERSLPPLPPLPQMGQTLPQKVNGTVFADETESHCQAGPRRNPLVPRELRKFTFSL